MLNLTERARPVPWEDGGKIPWDEPGFSARMLREHLTQDHDRASRRLAVIERQVSWIHETILENEPARVLDLGCGPGLYSNRLARLGHSCVGIDFSPASISHARETAAEEGLGCEFRQQDLRDGQFGSSFRLALLIFGEFNAFAPADARALLAEAHRSLGPSGTLVLEVQTEEAVREIGLGSPNWWTEGSGLFCDEPYLCLRECFWFPEAAAAVERFFVAPVSTGEFETYLSTAQAYTDGEYDSMLAEAGFTDVSSCASLDGDDEQRDGLFVLTAKAAA